MSSSTSASRSFVSRSVRLSCALPRRPWAGERNHDWRLLADLAALVSGIDSSRPFAGDVTTAEERKECAGSDPETSYEPISATKLLWRALRACYS
jgi:hypothetical protein